MRYRRAIVPGGTFFFTPVTDRRRPILASDEAVDILRHAFRSVRQSRPFEIDAVVVMSDHLCESGFLCVGSGERFNVLLRHRT